jgi:hypothetical protein
MLWFSSAPTCDFCPATKKLIVHLFKKSASKSPVRLTDDPVGQVKNRVSLSGV